MSLTLGHALNQKDPLLLPGDIDDCWVVAAIQCARALGGAYGGDGRVSLPAATGTAHIFEPTIPQFRKFASKPDVQGVSNGGSADDILKGSLGSWSHLKIARASTSWDTFVHQVRDLGWPFAALAVNSALLPSTLRYGFYGAHEVSVQYVAGSFRIVNPLMPAGTMPATISVSALKRAALGLTGYVMAVIYRLPEVAPAPVPAPTPTPTPVPTTDATPYSQLDLDAAKNAGYAAGVAETKRLAHIVY